MLEPSHDRRAVGAQLANTCLPASHSQLHKAWWVTTPIFQGHRKIAGNSFRLYLWSPNKVMLAIRCQYSSQHRAGWHPSFIYTTQGVPSLYQSSGQGDMYRTYEHTTRDTTINQNELNMHRLLIRLRSSGRQETGLPSEPRVPCRVHHAQVPRG